MSKINDEGFLELSGISKNVVEGDLHPNNFKLLEGMTPLSLRLLNQASRVMKVGAGVEMMHAGDTPHDLYFISKGTISIAKEIGGKQKIIAQLRSGDFYGEYGALRGKTRFASVFTAEPSTIIRVDLNAIKQVFDADEKFRERIYEVMKGRMLNSFLFGHPVFQGLTADVRSDLAKVLVITEVKRDEIVFKAGDAADKYYLVLSGEAEVMIGDGQKEVVVEIRRDNDSLGEVRAQKGKVYAYTVRTPNNLDLVLLDKNTMQMIHKLDPQIIGGLNKMMAAQVKKTIGRIEKLTKP